MFVGPDPALGVQGQTLDIAVAQGPDLGPGTGLANEGIAGVGGAVVPQAQDLAEMGAQVLGLVADVGPGEGQGRITAVADAHQQALIGQKEQAGAKMLRA